MQRPKKAIKTPTLFSISMSLADSYLQTSCLLLYSQGHYLIGGDFLCWELALNLAIAITNTR